VYCVAGNFAIAYVGKIDTHFHKASGVRGVLMADAVQNVVGIAVLVGLFSLVLDQRKNAPAPATS
jgi:hypothetical protein